MLSECQYEGIAAAEEYYVLPEHINGKRVLG
jgi:hypothetical protein